jgi:hypothetical protein
MTRQSIAEELESAADRIADVSRADLQIILRRAALMLRNVTGVPLEPNGSSQQRFCSKGGKAETISRTAFVTMFGSRVARVVSTLKMPQTWPGRCVSMMISRAFRHDRSTEDEIRIPVRTVGQVRDG